MSCAMRTAPEQAPDKQDENSFLVDPVAEEEPQEIVYELELPHLSIHQDVHAGAASNAGDAIPVVTSGSHTECPDLVDPNLVGIQLARLKPPIAGSGATSPVCLVHVSLQDQPPTRHPGRSVDKDRPHVR